MLVKWDQFPLSSLIPFSFIHLFNCYFSLSLLWHSLSYPQLFPFLCTHTVKSIFLSLDSRLAFVTCFDQLNAAKLIFWDVWGPALKGLADFSGSQEKNTVIQRGRSNQLSNAADRSSRMMTRNWSLDAVRCMSYITWIVVVSVNIWSQVLIEVYSRKNGKKVMSTNEYK